VTTQRRGWTIITYYYFPEDSETDLAPDDWAAVAYDFGNLSADQK
jgi:hypothetical protein